MNYSLDSCYNRSMLVSLSFHKAVNLNTTHLWRKSGRNTHLHGNLQSYNCTNIDTESSCISPHIYILRWNRLKVIWLNPNRRERNSRRSSVVRWRMRSTNISTKYEFLSLILVQINTYFSLFLWLRSFVKKTKQVILKNWQNMCLKSCRPHPTKYVWKVGFSTLIMWNCKASLRMLLISVVSGYLWYFWGFNERRL